MSVQHVIALFRRAEALKKEVDGTGDVGGDKKSEIFRLFGMIEWVLKERRRVLEVMEDQALARQIQEALEEAKKEIKRTQIQFVALEPVNVKKELPSFPKYLELPGPVVREKILSFLSSDDLLAVATAIPSEVQYFPQPLLNLQMQAVFPILMQKKLLEPKDVMNLSGVDPYVCDFIVKYYENVIWTNSEQLYYLSVTLEDLIGLEGDYPVVSLVRFKLNGGVGSTSLEQLRVCGKRILHCVLNLHAVEGDQLTMERIASCLELMPNLRTLCIEDPGFVQQEIAGLVLPELPRLRNFHLLNFSDRVLQSMMLRKYGEKLELVYLNEPGEPPIGFQIPSPEASVTVLKLVFVEEPEPMEKVLNNLRTFAHCPLKELHLSLMDSIFQRLLIFLSNHWEGTLEVLKIRFMNLYSHGDHYDGNWNPNWMMNLCLPKLRYFTTDYYPCYMNWSILLLFPALEELTICEVGEECECTSCMDWYDDDSEHEDDGAQPIIQFQCDKDAVLSSNLWKLFPKLEKVTFDTYKIFGSVTWKECIAAQMEM